MVMGFKGAVWRSRWRLILIEYWFDLVGLRGYRVDVSCQINLDEEEITRLR